MVPDDVIFVKTLGVLVELLAGDLFACNIIFGVRSRYAIFAMRHDRVFFAGEADGCVAIISHRSIDTPHKRAVRLDIFHIITFMERAAAEMVAVNDAIFLAEDDLVAGIGIIVGIGKISSHHDLKLSVAVHIKDCVSNVILLLEYALFPRGFDIFKQNIHALARVAEGRFAEKHVSERLGDL